MKTKDEVKKSRRAGADVAFERLRCADGAVKSDCTDMALREIADPIHRGLPAYENERNKARMSMKTKDGVENVKAS